MRGDIVISTGFGPLLQNESLIWEIYPGILEIKTSNDSYVSTR